MKQTTFSNNSRKIITMLAIAGILGMATISPSENNINLSTGKTNNDMQHASTNNIPTMKTIGILGGLGPQATMDLEMRIHKIAQQTIPQAQNSGYPSMVVQYYRHAPILLTQDHQPVMPWQADPRMLAAAQNLGKIADFIIVPSNGVHLFQKDIEQSSGRKVLSMIDATLEEAKKRGWKKIGVLGLMNPMVYTTRLKELGISFETIDTQLQEKLNQAIFKVMEGREDDADRGAAIDAIKQLRSKNVDGIIPGCTELPFLLGDHMNAKDILNPVQILAEAAVKYSVE